MTPELISLLLFLAVFAALLLAQPLLLAKAKGMPYVMGNRADDATATHPVIGRLARTVANSIEAAVLFIPLVLVIEIYDASNTLTQWGAIIFVAARAAYAVLYPLGVVGLRSLVWNAGFAALAAMALGLLGA